MSALLELIRETPPDDLKKVAKELQPYLEIKKPSLPLPETIGTKEFQKMVPGHKAKEWLRTFIYPRADATFVLSYNRGKGHPDKLLKEAAIKWLNEHSKEIDWDEPLPK